MKKIYTLLFFFIATVALQAQPTDSELLGCHYRKRNLHCEPLTAQRIAEINAANLRSDTFDIVHYNIKTDISSYSSKKIKGECSVFFAPKMPNLTSITLDLLGLTVDSVKNAAGESLSFNHQGLSLLINFPTAYAQGDTNSITVWYQGTPIQSPSDFGGVYFESNYIYNLSIGLTDDPHNFGHAWFPCFDNFEERSTYELSFLTTLPFRTYATGDFVAETPLPNDNQKVWRSYTLDVPSCTYHVSFAAADYGHIVRPHTNLWGEEYPIELLAHHSDTTKTKNACINYLHEALDCFEYWFGPYPYNKVGYAIATRGAMENPGNTIYPASLIEPGNLSVNISILTHELAHQWWGNVVTVGSEADMWVKEGNAEYGAHLFIEHLSGEDAFVELEKANNLDMLKNAHISDGAYLPLSPMPHSITYGTTTYNKGAMTMHNLRYYLGDSLFRSGMTYLQTALRYEAMDAYEMRDTLSAFTGVDLTDFFADWIFNPGWADYALDSCVVTPLANGTFQADVHVRQGLRASNHFHHNTPVEVNFRKANGDLESVKMMVAGEHGSGSFILPFEPTFCMLNRNQKLNLAQVNYEKDITAPGSVSAGNTGFTMTVKAVPPSDTAFFWAEHHWSAPEITPNLPSTVKLSSTHYWRVDGVWPEGFVTNGVFRYDDGSTNTELDADLLVPTPEDSIMLLWRPGAGHEWQLCPRTTQLTFTSTTDGFGIFRADTMLRGEYAFATGYIEQISGTQTPKTDLAGMEVFPNPTKGDVQVFVKNPMSNECVLSVNTLWGVEVYSEIIPSYNGNGLFEWNTEALPAGVYLLQLTDNSGKVIAVEKLIKQ